MEKEKVKNNTGLIILLVLIILGLVGYIVYDKVLLNKETETITNYSNLNNEEENNIEQEKKSLPEWAEYLLKQDIKNIKSADKQALCDGNGNLVEIDTKQISIEDIKLILIALNDNSTKLTKFIHPSGGSGPCNNTIEIEYNNSKKIVFSYSSNNRTFKVLTEDEEILNLLEKEKYEEIDAYNTYVGDPGGPDYIYDVDTSIIFKLLEKNRT